MLRFSLLGFPIRVQPWFFLTAFLIGPRGGDPARVATWIAAAFVGVLLHELGHALAARAYGQAPAIELHGFGGVTAWSEGRPLRPLQRVAVTAAGPGVGIAVGLAVIVVARALAPAPGSPAQWLLLDLVWVNLGWAVLNLAPILPLDGGVIVAAAAERVWGPAGMRAAQVGSLVLAATASVAALASGSWWLALVTGVLAFVNLQAVRGGRRRPPAGSSNADQKPLLDALAAAFNRRDWEGVETAAGRLLAAADGEQLRAHALYFLAWGRLERGDPVGARQAVEGLPAGMVDDPALTGSLLLAEGRPREAVAELEAALTREGDPVVADRWVEAVVASSSFERAAELLAAGGGRRLGADALVRLVEAAAHAGRASLLAQALARRQGDPNAALPLARVLVRAGERDAARAMLAAALKGRTVDREAVARDPELSGLL